MSTTPTGEVRVLVVEDDDAVRSAIERGLGVLGFEITSVGTAEAAIDALARRRVDVMIVDVGLPGMSGIELCRRLRDLVVETPVLILSARDQVGDRVAGLEAGADDYLVKPFALDELAARVNALRRRARWAPTDGTIVTAGPLWIDLERRHAAVDGARLELSRREFDLLVVLAMNPGIVLSRVRLLERVWGYDFDVDTNVVDVFVGYLRRKLERAGTARMIETVRGVGFVLKVA